MQRSDEEGGPVWAGSGGPVRASRAHLSLSQKARYSACSGRCSVLQVDLDLGLDLGLLALDVLISHTAVSRSAAESAGGLVRRHRPVRCRRQSKHLAAGAVSGLISGHRGGVVHTNGLRQPKPAPLRLCLLRQNSRETARHLSGGCAVTLEVGRAGKVDAGRTGTLEASRAACASGRVWVLNGSQ